ncbi:MAG: hypothetical protein ACRC80_29550 [Waterburya sp.]
MDINDFYRVSRSNGMPDAINEIVSGKSLPFPIQLHEDHPWVKELREKEALYGKLDLSDREPEVIIQPLKYRIYNYIETEDPCKFPGNIIFPDSLDTYLPKTQKIFFGERVKTTYFDPTSKESVIQVDYKFNRDKKGFLLSTERSISFYLEDGSVAERKKEHLIPVASQFEQLDELKRRRANIVAEVQSLAFDFNLVEQMNEIYNVQTTNISRYQETGSPFFKNFLAADTNRAWLNAPSTIPGKTIREVLIMYFSIGLLHD